MPRTLTNDASSTDSTAAVTLSFGNPTVGIQTVVQDATELTLRWWSFNNTRVIIDYKTEVATSWTRAGEFGRLVQTTTLGNLVPNTTYILRLTPFKASTPGSTVSTTVSTRELATVTFATLQATDTAVNTTWTSVGAGKVRVEYGQGSAPSTFLYWREYTSQTSISTIDDLVPATNYAVKLTPIRADGSVGPSVTQNVTTLPKASANIQSIAATDTALTTTWNLTNASAGRVEYRLNSSTSTFVLAGQVTPQSPSLTITNLSSGSQYNLRLTPILPNSASSSPLDFVTSTSPTPTVTVQSTQATDSTLTLAWTASNASRVRVRYRQGSDPFAPSQTYTLPTQSATLTGLQANATYTVELFPVRSDDTDGPSTTVQRSTLSTISTAFSSVLGADTYISLAWTVDGAARVRVSYGLGSSPTTFETWREFSAPTTSTTIDKLASSTTYTLKLTPVRVDGTEGSSVTQTFETLPAASASLQDVVASDTSLQTTWALANAAAGRVEYRLNSSSASFVLAGQVSPQSPSLTISNLGASSQYVVRLTPILSNSATGTPVDEVRSTTAAPTVVVLSSQVTDTTLAVLWTSTNATKVRVRYRTSAGAFTQPTDYEASTQSATITGLDADTSYFVELSPVRADDTAGQPTTISTRTLGPPSVSASASATDTALAVSWTSLGASKIRMEYRSAASEAFVTKNTFVQLAFTDTISGLTPSTQYVVRLTPLRADDTAGTPFVLTTSTTGSPTVTFGEVSVTNSAITVQWTATNAAKVRVEYSAGSSFIVRGDYDAAQSTVTIVGLAANTQYTVRLTPLRADGTPGVAESRIVSTGTVASPVVSDVQVQASETSLALTWSVIDTTKTRIEYKTSTSNFEIWREVVAATASTTITDLVPDTQYTVKVTGLRADGSEGGFQQISATTTKRAATVSSPFLQATETSVIISWISQNAANVRVAYGMGSAPSSFTDVGDFVASTSSATINGLVADTIYTVRLTPLRSDNVAGAATSASVTTEKPRAVVATPLVSSTDTTLTVTWASSFAAKVRVEYADMSNAWLTVGEFVPPVTTTTISQLSASTTYRVRLTPVRDDDVAGSAVVTTTATIAPLLPTVTAPTLFASDTAIAVSWSARNVSQVRIDYAVGENPSDALYQTVQTFGAGIQSTLILGVTSRTTYTVRATPISASGSSGSSTTAAVTTTGSSSGATVSFPSLTAGPTVQTQGTNSYLVSWTPSNADKVRVQCNSSTLGEYTSDIRSVLVQLRGETPNLVVQLTPLSGEVAGIPQTRTVTAQGSPSVQVRQVMVSDSDIRVEWTSTGATDVEVRRAVGAGAMTTVGTVDASIGFAVLRDLLPTTTYTVRLIPKSGAQSGTAVDTTVFTTPRDDLNYAPGGYDIILLMGQSNMTGSAGGLRSGNPGLTYTEPSTDSRIYQMGFEPLDRVSLATEPLQHPEKGSTPVGGGSIGMTFARTYADSVLAPGRRVLLIPAAWGNTGFIHPALPASVRPNYTGAASLNNTWDVEYAQTNVNGNRNLLRAALDRTRMAMAYSEPDSRTPTTSTAVNPLNRVAAVLWHQGEHSIFMTEQAYKSALSNLVGYVRSELSYSTSADYIPFLVGNFHPLYAQLHINSGPMKVLPSVGNPQYFGQRLCLFSDSQRLANIDTWHFDSISLWTMGKRYFSAYSSIPRIDSVTANLSTNNITVKWQASTTQQVFVEYKLQSASTFTASDDITWPMDTKSFLTVEAGMSYIIQLTPKNTWDTRQVLGVPVQLTVTTPPSSTTSFNTLTAPVLVPTANTVSVSWTTTATSVTLQFRAPPNAFGSALTFTTTSQTTLRNLAPNTNYEVQLTPRWATGESGPAVLSTTRTLVAGPVVDTIALTSTDNTITVNWTATNTTKVRVDIGGGAVPTAWEHVGEVLVSTASGSSVITNRLPSTQYTVRLTPVDATDSNGAPRTSSTTTLPPPSATLSLSNRTETSIDAVWSSSNAARVRIDYGVGTAPVEFTNLQPTSTFNGSSTPVTATIANLSGSTQYTVRVTPLRADSTSSTPASQTTTTLTPPGVQVRSSQQSETTIALEWILSGNATRVRVEYKTASTTFQQWGSSDFETTSTTLTGLLSDTLYTLRLTPVRANQTLGTPTTTQISTDPVDPTRVYDIGVSPLDNVVDVSWKLDNAVRVLIERAQGLAAFEPGAEFSGLSTTIAGILPLTQYSLRFTPIRSDNTRGRFVTRSFTSLAAPQVVPGNTTSTDTSLTVSWTVSGAPFVRILYKSTGSFVQWQQDFASSVTTTTIAGLTEGTVYTVQYVPVRSNQTTASPAEREIRTRPPPSIPTLTLTPADTLIRVQWTSADAAFVQIEYATGASPSSWTAWPSPTALFSTSETQATITGLSPSTTYTVRARALRSNQTVGNSRTATETTAAALVVTNVSITSLDNSATVSWTTNASKTRVQYAGGGIDFNAGVEVTATSYVIESLTPSTLYTVRLTPVRFDGTSATPTASTTTTAPAPVATISVTATDYYIDAAWTITNTTRVLLQYALLSSTVWTTVNTYTLPQLTQRIGSTENPLVADSEYRVRVLPLRTNDTEGTPASQNIRTIRTPTVTNIILAPGPTSINARWTPVNVAQVRVAYRTTAGSYVPAGDFSLVNETTIANLSALTSYFVRFTPVRSDETLAPSTELSVTTTDLPPATVSSTMFKSTSTSIVATWTSTNAANVRVATAISNNSPVFTTLGDFATGTSTISNLTNNTAYLVRLTPVRADGALGSAITNTVSTLPAPSFAISFTGTSLPTQDDTAAWTLRSVGTPSIVNDATRGFVIRTDTGYLVSNYYVPLSFTKAVWVYCTNTVPTNQNALSSGGATVNGDPLWVTNGSMTAGINNSITWMAETTKLPANTWIHYAVTYDKPTGAFIMYRNGSQVASKPFTARTGPSQYVLCIGKYYEGVAGTNWVGYLDNVRVYSRALTAAEVSSLYQNELPVSPQVSVSSVSASNTTYTLSWSSLNASRVRVQYGEGLEATTVVGDLSTDSTTISNLTPGTAYTFQLTPLREDNSEADPISVTDITLAPGASVTPGLATAYDTYFVVTWTSVAADRVRVEWKPADTYVVWDTVAVSVANSTTITGASPSTQYPIRLTAIQADNTEDAVVEDFVTTTPPAAAAFTTTTPTDVAVSLAWTLSYASNTRVEYASTGNSYTVWGTFSNTSTTIANLLPSTLYNLRLVPIRANNTDGSPTTSNATTLSLLSITSASLTTKTSTITAVWTTSYAASVRVEWGPSASPSDWVLVGTFATTSTTISGLSSNATYTVRLTPVRPDNSLGAPTTVTATTDLPTPSLTSPTTDRWDVYIGLAWTLQFADYAEVAYKTSSALEYTAWGNAATTTTITNLTPNTSYNILLTPYRTSGLSGTPVFVNTSTTPTPTANIQSVQTSLTSITISWLLLHTTTARVEYAPTSTLAYTTLGTYSTTSSATISNLSSGVEYTIKFVPIRGDSTEAPAVTTTATTLSVIPYVTTPSLTAGETSVAVLWFYEDANFVKVEYKTAEGQFTQFGSLVAAPTNTTTITGLNANTTYTVRLTPRTTSGTEGPATQASTTTLAAPSVSQPVLTATDLQIAVSWSSQNAAFVQVLYKSTGEFVQYGENFANTITSTTIPNVAANTLYTVRLVPLRADLTAGAHSETTITTPGAPTVSQPTLTTTDNSVTASWTSANAVRVRVQLSTDGTTFTNVGEDLLAAITSTTITNLSASTTYTIRLIPLRNDNSAGTSAQNTVTTLPAPIVNSVTFERQDIFINVTYSVSNAAKVRLLYRTTGDFVQWGTDSTSLQNTIKVTGLVASTTYTFRVTPVRSDNTTGTSYDKSASTIPTISVSSPLLTASDNSIVASWTTSNASSVVVAYKVSTAPSFTTFATVTSGTSSTIVGLAATTTYNVRLTPRRSDNSEATFTEGSTTTSATPTVTSLTAQVTHETVMATWTSSNASKVRLEWGYGASPASWTLVADYLTTTTTALISGLNSNATVTTRATALRADNSTAANTSTSTTTTVAPRMFVKFGAATFSNNSTDATGTVTLTQYKSLAIHNDATRGYVMNGSNGCIFTNFFTPQSYTKTAWVYLITATNSIANNVLSSNGSADFLYVDTTYRLVGGHTPGQNIVSDTINVPVGAWTHYAFSWNNSTRTFNMYRNGAVTNTRVMDATYNRTGNSSIALNIGRYTADTQFWKGYLDNLRVYDVALTASNISALYQTELNNPTSV